MCNKLPYCNPRRDKCLIETLQTINTKTTLKTLASCCGHDKYPKTIVVKDADGIIYEMYSGVLLGKRKRNRYYKTDEDKYYYIPEVVEFYERRRGELD